tara:strand:+ start:857 stop:2347 length:1491 start_codon:yes stop_codon:yes gene_type:complete
VPGDKTINQQDTASNHARWARFRFAVIGPLLASPPAEGRLQDELHQLAQKTWAHPITTLPVTFGLSTLERWFYRARLETDPVRALKTKRRDDAGLSRTLSAAMKQALITQYRAHKSWSYKLHSDNFAALCRQQPALGEAPSYSTLRRHMKAQGMVKQRRIKTRETAGTLAAEERLERREVRSYEVDHVHGLWHLDFHHGSRKILTADGRWETPMLLGIIDDRSRVMCHAQWYLDETAQSLVHGFAQAIQRRQLPRSLMTDNGAAMVSAEFTQGLEQLGILHQTTLPYSPYQNGKQEYFWTHIEGRLLPMLEGEAELTLALLNEATQAWLEGDYHHKPHSELGCSPIDRYLAGPDVGRKSPDSTRLRQAFRQQVTRKQRRSDGTVSIDGQRFEVPHQYRYLESITVQYARWDLSHLSLMDPQDNRVLCPLYPLDKSANASGLRRTITPLTSAPEAPPTSAGIAPLLKQLMADYAETGLPPSYIPKDDIPTATDGAYQ